MKNGKHVIVRSYGAGVFFGKVKSIKGKEVVLQNARRLWYWSGAASLSQLAMEGTKNPSQCKFPCPVTEVYLTDVIEIIPTTKKAEQSIDGVAVWSA